MGYAIKQDGSWRAAKQEMALMDGETYADELLEPINAEQSARQPVIVAIETLRKELTMAEIAFEQMRANQIRREISRLKYISGGI